jgi:hypothetical protein
MRVISGGGASEDSPRAIGQRWRGPGGVGPAWAGAGCRCSQGDGVQAPTSRHGRPSEHPDASTADSINQGNNRIDAFQFYKITGGWL